MTPILLALLAGAVFGGFAVSLRWAVEQQPSAEVGAFSFILVAFIAVCATTVAALPGSAVTLANCWPLLLSGAIVPGLSHVLFIRAIRDCGPSRAAVIVGMSPLLSVAIALTALGEPFRPLLGVAATLIVVGGLLLVLERTHPAGVAPAGLGVAATVAVIFATRDDLLRSISRTHSLPPLLAASCVLVAGLIVAGLIIVVRRPAQLTGRTVCAAIRVFAPAGLLFGAGYVLLLAAYDHGRVSLVSPLNGTQALWAMVFSAAMFSRTEVLGRRVVTAAALIVSGVILTGVAQ